jgi:peptidoglycan hydrolase-like protein with peptidoglycan-binding domain
MTMRNFAKLVPIPPLDTINIGLHPGHQATMLKIFGVPGALSRDCSNIANRKLEALIETRNVGPFKATGIGQLLDHLTEIFSEVKGKLPEVFAQVESDGMLCCRAVRGSKSNFSNHSWGTAIDIRFGDESDEMGDGLMQLGTSALAPFFHVRGWYWGIGFAATNPKREDSMHFEASDELIRQLFGGESGLIDSSELIIDTATDLTIPLPTRADRKLQSELLSGDEALEAIAEGHGVLHTTAGTAVDAAGTLQDALNLLSRFNPEFAINLGPDNRFRGFFGQKTKAAVEAFQAANDLDVDGRVGQDSILALDAALLKLDAAIVRPPEVAAPTDLTVPGDDEMLQPDPSATPVGAPIPFATKSSKGKFQKDSSETTGSSGQILRMSDGTEIATAAEDLHAVREGKDLGRLTATQRRVRKGNITTIRQNGYAYKGREFRVVRIEEKFDGFDGNSGVEKVKATRFGKFDKQDGGTGSGAENIVQTNSDVWGASVKRSRLERVFGKPFKQLAGSAELLNAMVEVFNEKTGKFARVPLVDVGPREDLEAELDLTFSVDEHLGNEGSARVLFRIT